MSRKRLSAFIIKLRILEMKRLSCFISVGPKSSDRRGEGIFETDTEEMQRKTSGGCGNVATSRRTSSKVNSH